MYRDENMHEHAESIVHVAAGNKQTNIWSLVCAAILLRWASANFKMLIYFLTMQYTHALPSVASTTEYSLDVQFYCIYKQKSSMELSDKR